MTTKHFAVLIKKGCIDKQRVEGTRNYKYKWTGPRPSMHTIDAVLAEISSMKNKSNPEPSEPIEREMCTQDDQGNNEYTRVPIMSREEGDFLVCKFPKKFSTLILTVTGQELLTQH